MRVSRRVYSCLARTFGSLANRCQPRSANGGGAGLVVRGNQTDGETGETLEKRTISTVLSVTWPLRFLLSVSTRIKPPRSFRASFSFSSSFLLPVHPPSRLFAMAVGAAATAGPAEGFMHLVDPNRKWYNNKRYVAPLPLPPTPADCSLGRLIILHAWLVLL